MHTLEGETRPVLTFGLEEGDVHAANLTWNRGLPAFDIIYRGEFFTRVGLRVPGEHNVKNALAAAAAAIALAVSPKAVSEGLGAFRGAGRRFEHKGTYHGAEVYDDYAHHPGELQALLAAARTLGYERIICAFQPHTYTRTKALFDDFVKVLRQPTSPCWRRSTPHGKPMRSVSPLRIWPIRSPAASTAPLWMM